MLNNIGQCTRTKRNESSPWNNGVMHTLDLYKVGVDKTILVSLKPECLDLVASIVEQGLYKRLEVLFLSTHRCFIHYQEDAHTASDASMLEDDRELEQHIRADEDFVNVNGTKMFTITLCRKPAF